MKYEKRQEQIEKQNLQEQAERYLVHFEKEKKEEEGEEEKQLERYFVCRRLESLRGSSDHLSKTVLTKPRSTFFGELQRICTPSCLSVTTLLSLLVRLLFSTAAFSNTEMPDALQCLPLGPHLPRLGDPSKRFHRQAADQTAGREVGRPQRAATQPRAFGNKREKGKRERPMKRPIKQHCAQ